MARELAISLYLLVFRIIFNICKLFPQKKKTTFISSFGDNVLYTVNELEKQTDDRVVILKTSQCRIDFNKGERMVLLFEPKHLFEWVHSIYHLATSRMIFVDNYFGFLAVADFKSDVKCIQLWHAAGAIKQFGLKDPSNDRRSPRAIQRFQQVYDRFDHVVVGSEKMAAIFRESFGLGDDRMLRTGIPRTDFYFEKASEAVASQELKQTLPLIGEKKVILYAPTFRDEALDSAEIMLDVDRLYEEFASEYVLLLRLHPAIQGKFLNQYPGFVIDVSGYPDIHRLLVVTDVLVTDYSSIPFEFSLLGRPMIFFAYDLEVYEEARGFREDYKMLIPGPVVRDTEALIDVMKEGQFDYERILTFAEEWNEYSDGTSSKCLIEAVYERATGVSE
ncbi:CDP-glycerol glycerophosphotransferase family protein [Virgibacillus sp. MSJ-26]|uniref:CDP-glycerol glycerophosphotransferase family protein n=1 Tax=Virgibacillus sp. MSJ-26 TaxID=2841522 RepID=UPI001C0F6A7B|nr:CDP-glycerol glycerophosphotransferase family protein [Virgibacillus sp. MSJ-26]MBU5465337.1 CDP-glycerol glycerophosphotransferase family protein [Virgibacillus sp. MSJ-26]